MEAVEEFECLGHPLISGRHRTTLEVTKEESLTKNGDCIIGVSSAKGAADLSGDFKRILASDDSTLHTVLSAGGIEVTISSRGSQAMALDHPTDMVWRRSGFVCGRTVGIFSDKTALTLPRELIRLLSEGERMYVKMTASNPRQDG